MNRVLPYFFLSSTFLSKIKYLISFFTILAKERNLEDRILFFVGDGFSPIKDIDIDYARLGGKYRLALVKNNEGSFEEEDFEVNP